MPKPLPDATWPQCRVCGLSNAERFWALRHSLNTIVSMVSRDKHPRVFAVLSRTVAKVDSIGLVVLKCAQYSAGKS